MSDKPKEVSAEVANSILIEAKAKERKPPASSDFYHQCAGFSGNLGISGASWLDRQQIFVCAHYSSKNIYTEIVRSEAGWSRIGSSYYHEFEIGSGRVLQRSYRRRSTGNDYGILSYF